MNSKTELLNKTQISQKIERLAYQLYEDNVEEKEIILAGIAGNGYVLAEKMAITLRKISGLKVQLLKIKLNKKAPLSEDIVLTPADLDMENKVVAIVDDVLNSGRTLIYGMRPFLELPLKKIRTIVLADRSHKRFPVSADFTGLTVSTTYQERITVVLEGENEKVYLE